MKYTIEDLRNGEVAVINDGTLEQLKEVLKKAFPRDKCIPCGSSLVYSRSDDMYKEWFPTSQGLPKQSVKDFLKPEFEEGDWIEVSDDGNEWAERIFLHKFTEKSFQPFACVSNYSKDDYCDGKSFGVSLWERARPIQKEEVDIKITVNGEEKDPKDFSEESWNNLRKKNQDMNF